MAQVIISGTIKVVGKTQEVSPSFRKRELVITEPSGKADALWSLLNTKQFLFIQ